MQRRSSLAVGVLRATLDGCRPDGRVKPNNVGRSPALVASVLEMGPDYPIDSKTRVAEVLTREGRTTSEISIGLILRHPMGRGYIQRIPDQRRKAIRTAYSQRLGAMRGCSKLLPVGPGEVIRVDTLTVMPKRGRPSKLRPDGAAGMWTIPAGLMWKLELRIQARRRQRSSAGFPFRPRI